MRADIQQLGSALDLALQQSRLCTTYLNATQEFLYTKYHTRLEELVGSLRLTLELDVEKLHQHLNNTGKLLHQGTANVGEL